MTEQEIEDIFTYHKPSDAQVPKYVEIRAEARSLAHLINDDCPESREKSLALTKLQEAVMMANAAIAIHS